MYVCIFRVRQFITKYTLWYSGIRVCHMAGFHLIPVTIENAKTLKNAKILICKILLTFDKIYRVFESMSTLIQLVVQRAHQNV